MGDPTEEILNIESMEIGELTKAANAAAWLIPGFSQGYAARARESIRVAATRESHADRGAGTRGARARHPVWPRHPSLLV
ncbi:MAG TPA: hypothetical protein DEA59_10690, partial [Microbacterium sp.]|nr:hypothetical protein [Microbacterium sp.]HBR89716.1 hypothetical protein [Microbacterium sp.]